MEEEDLEWDQLECGYLFASLFLKKNKKSCSESWLAVHLSTEPWMGDVYCCL